MANTIGEKELKRKWDSLTASDATKRIGHKQNLTPELDSKVLRKDRVGI